MPEMLLVTLLVGNFVLNLIILIFVVVLLRKNNSHTALYSTNISATKRDANQSEEFHGLGVVFCRNCGNPYDSSKTACPECNMSR